MFVAVSIVAVGMIVFVAIGSETFVSGLGRQATDEVINKKITTANRKVFTLIPLFGNSSKRLTVGVTRLGWEGGFALETGFRRSQKHAQKRGAYPKSGARIVSPLLNLKAIFLP